MVTVGTLRKVAKNRLGAFTSTRDLGGRRRHAPKRSRKKNGGGARVAQLRRRVLRREHEAQPLLERELQRRRQPARVLACTVTALYSYGPG